MDQNRINKIIKIIAYLVIAFLLNQICQVFFPRLPVMPDFFFTLIWVFAYLYSDNFGIPLAIASCLLRDWLYSPIFGISLLVGLFTYYLAGHFLQLIWQRKLVFLPLQITVATVVSVILEKIIFQFSAFLQFDLSINLYNLDLFSKAVVRGVGLNLLATIVWTLIFKTMLPFIKSEKDIYAEDLAGVKGDI